jgi:hypothetical protein
MVYTPVQLGIALHRAMDFQRKTAPAIPTPESKKRDFIKHVTKTIYNLLETETRQFNATNPDNRVLTRELVGSVQRVLDNLLGIIGTTTKPS